MNECQWPMARRRRRGANIQAMVAVCVAAQAGAGLAAEPAVCYPCVRTSVAPAIDGRLDDACWQRACRGASFVYLGRHARVEPDRQTTFWLLHDAANLYVAVRCEEPNLDKLKIECKTREARDIWRDDCVELFFDATKGAKVDHLVVNAGGAFLGLWEGSWEIKKPVTVAAGRDSHAWTVEIAIPRTHLTTAAAASAPAWRFNVCRHRTVNEDASTWAYLRPGNQGFLQPERFARLQWVGAEAGDVPKELAAATRPQREFLQNGGFDAVGDDGMPVGWTGFQKTRCQEQVFASGDYALVNDAGYVVAVQEVNLDLNETGRDLTLTFRARGDGDACLGAIAFCQNAAGKQKTLYLLWKSAAPATWTAFSRKLPLPDDAVTLVGIWLYRANKQGRVCYDRVSLRADAAGSALDITSFGDYGDQALYGGTGQTFDTPHIPWARPRAQGKLKVMVVLPNFRYLRDAHELAQRLEMDYDLLVCPDHRSRVAMAANGAAVRERLGRGRYCDVFIVATASLSTPLQQAILKQVSKGAGLVYLHPGRFSPATETATELEAALPPAVSPVELPASSPLSAQALGAVDPSVFPATHAEPRIPGYFKRVGFGTYGKGRVVNLRRPSRLATALVPSTSAFRDPDTVLDTRYWEYFFSTLIRCVDWAVGQPAAVDVGRVKVAASDGTASLVVRAGHALQAQVVVRSMDMYGREAERHRSSVSLAAGDNALRLGLGGPVGADVRVLNVFVRDPQGRNVGWASTALAPNEGLQAKLAADAASYPLGSGPIEAEVSLRNHRDRGRELDAEVVLVDGFDRCVARQARTVRLAAGESGTMRMTLPRPHAVTRLHALRLEAREQGRVVATAKRVLCLESDYRDTIHDYLFSLKFYHQRRYARRHLARFVAQEFGVNVTSAPWHRSQTPLIASANLPMVDAWRARYACGPDILHFRPPEGSSANPHVRVPCIYDEALRATIRERLGESADFSFRELTKPVFPLYYHIADEASLAFSMLGSTIPEVCFCPRCTARFRQWLRQRYATLGDVNAAWKTTFATWDDIEPVSFEQARRKPESYGQWVDFRAFMRDAWTDFAQWYKDIVLTADPNGRYVFSQPITGQEDPFNGWDTWRMSRIETLGVKYLDKHDGVIEEYRSYYRGKPLLTCIGYCGQTREHMRFTPWWLALHGSGILFYTITGYDVYPSGNVSPTNLLGPALDHTGRSLALRDQMADLKRGIGRLILNTPRPRARIAILASYPSMLVAWCESDVTINRFATYYELLNTRSVADKDNTAWFWRKAAKAAWEANLEQVGYGYDYVSTHALSADALAAYDALILPYCVALSRRDCDVVEGFVREGNLLIANAPPAVYDEHGQPYGVSPLAKVFGREYRREQVKPRFANGVIRVSPSTSLAGARLGSAPTCVHKHGQGCAYLLGGMPYVSSANATAIASLLAGHGIEPDARVQRVDGTPPQGIECVKLAKGPLTLYGVVSDYNLASSSQALVIAVPGRQHTYELRKRRYLGLTDRMPVTLTPGDAVVFCQVPYRVEGIAVDAPETCPAGGAWPYTVRLATGGAKAATHVFDIAFHDPAGAKVFCYGKTELAKDGVFTGALPTALSDAPGTWTLEVADVVSGERTTLPFRILPARR